MPTTKPEGAVEYRVEIRGDPYTVWEFAFSKVKEFWGVRLHGIQAIVDHASKTIILNAALSMEKRKWALNHEIAHAIREQEGTRLPEELWDELETDLMVVAKAVPTDLHFSTHVEILRALNAYMKSNLDVRKQARKLVNWLRERTDAENEEGHYQAVKLPTCPIPGREWWNGS